MPSLLVNGQTPAVPSGQSNVPDPAARTRGALSGLGYRKLWSTLSMSNKASKESSTTGSGVAAAQSATDCPGNPIQGPIRPANGDPQMANGQHVLDNPSEDNVANSLRVRSVSSPILSRQPILSFLDEDETLRIRDVCSKYFTGNGNPSTRPLLLRPLNGLRILSEYHEFIMNLSFNFSLQA